MQLPRESLWTVSSARPLYGLGPPYNRCDTNVRDQPDASRGPTLVSGRRREESPTREGRMEYVALLRGINVGGTNKVVMSELREQIAAEGFTNVRTYINSGNLLFEADAEVGAGPSTPYEDVAQAIEDLLARRYEFPIRLALLTAQDYAAELRNLPDWWHGEVARRDALFYTRGLDSAHVRERIEAMELGDEAVHFGQHAVFWAKFDEKTFLKTAYHKRLLREDFYRQVTIRSGSTVGKIAAMLSRG